MKTIILNITFALAIMAIGTNAYADNTKGKKEKKARAEKIINKIEEKFDQELRFEDWMLELKAFAGKEVINEENLQFEDWMMSSFTVENEAGFQEQDLVFEPWMMSTFNSSEVNFTDEQMTFEPWMLSKF